MVTRGWVNTSPLSSSVRPASTRSSVDLPEPLRPTRQTRSPRASMASRPVNSSCRPIRSRAFFRARTGGAMVGTLGVWVGAATGGHARCPLARKAGRPNMHQDLIATFERLGVRDVEVSDDVDKALARITAIYEGAVERLRVGLGRFHDGRRAARAGRRLLPVRRRQAGRERPQPRRAAVLRRPARSWRLRCDPYPSAAVPGLLPHPAGAAGPQPCGPAGDRHQRPADPAAVRGRGDRQRPQSGAAAPAAVPVPDAGPQPHRRRHRQRHLAHQRPRAGAAGAVHRRARRLQPAAALPLHRHAPRILPALRAADQLPALRRALLRLRTPGDRRGRRV